MQDHTAQQHSLTHTPIENIARPLVGSRNDVLSGGQIGSKTLAYQAWILETSFKTGGEKIVQDVTVETHWPYLKYLPTSS